MGQTLPLHATTLQSVQFTLESALALDDQTISVRFSRPIDVGNTQIDVVNTETQKNRTIDLIETSSDDLRVVLIHLKGKMADDVIHDVIPIKVTALG